MHANRVQLRNDIGCCLAINVMAAMPYINSHYKWRNATSIQHAKHYCRSPGLQRPSVGVLFLGGCLDTLAAIRSGFKPIWGTEICERKRTIWSLLTGKDTPDLGDTFKVNWSNQESPDLLISGAPCTNYSSSGNTKGDEGETGWMFVKQADPILTLEPKAFVLEQVSNVVNVHSGRELKTLISSLRKLYVIKTKVIHTIDHGDGTNRQRLFIVGLHRRLGQAAYMFKFPKGQEGDPPPARTYQGSGIRTSTGTQK